MKYQDIVKKAIHSKRYSLSEVSTRLREQGIRADKAYLSKLQNGKIPAANDEINDALAKVLNIDPIELKILQQDPQAQPA